MDYKDWITEKAMEISNAEYALEFLTSQANSKKRSIRKHWMPGVMSKAG